MIAYKLLQTYFKGLEKTFLVSSYEISSTLHKRTKTRPYLSNNDSSGLFMGTEKLLRNLFKNANTTISNSKVGRGM